MQFYEVNVQTFQVNFTMNSGEKPTLALHDLQHYNIIIFLLFDFSVQQQFPRLNAFD